MNKSIYERPRMTRHISGLTNKVSHVQPIPPQHDIDGAGVEELLEKYGSPLFVFSQKLLEQRYRELHSAFTRRFPRFRPAWSYKTNYLGAICRTFHNLGAAAEVVSEFELDKAIAMGVPPSQIYFNGPYKPESALEKAFRGGSHVHLDNFDELALAETVAARLDVHPKVAIRVNLQVDGLTGWTRFGFNLESGQARDAVRRILSGKRLELDGLHCHLGTFIQDPSAYGQAAVKLAGFANEIREQFGVILSMIDMGGGFASHNTLKGQYLTGAQITPEFDRYAEFIAEGLAELNYPPSQTPELVLETGRALVDDAGFLLARVHSAKRLPDGRNGLVLDVGVNILFTSFWYKHEVVPASNCAGHPEPTVLFGPLCMNIDVIRDTLDFPPLKPGNAVVIRHVGAYNVTQWMQFITYRPAVVMVGTNGRHDLIRRRERLEDIQGMEIMPEWIRQNSSSSAVINHDKSSGTI